MKPGIIAKESVKLNIARLKKGGETFEIVLNPEKIVELKEGKIKDVRDVVESEKIFSDAKRGLFASTIHLQSTFSTEDEIKIIEIILKEGEIQLTQEYREKIREDKKRRIIDIIVRNAIDPRTNLPHPRIRIENSFEEIKVRIDEFKDPESQVNDVITSLRPILPIKFATKQITITIPAKFAGAGSNFVRRFGKISNENWLNDGSWSCVIEIPAGLQNDLFDQLNGLTHGDFQSEINEK
ncbi:ribosome assembly factor SBDS [archaeon]|jgi:ribosome maturation protein SDO1|nr:ribosome assembly factor SBDS [archaeon]MBT4351116.1 ribosome assembly factor SBDS [archaeon]MBT4648070.1 ribosome assembly factor SBDS [archaeon]MBT6822508.1 ribosome assembly factor SBDS [archaeon]MBT7392509.1 ribosome assembly factor SBDS [archaeon]